MAYQVIARKWRPKSFAELVGQEHISQTLSNALSNGRLPHALLFTGPRGTGKTSSARILAKSLRCPNAENFVPCNVCDECLSIAQGMSVDVIEIDGASNNGVDAIRELREGIGYRPSHGKHKVYIIDEVHMLSGSAFNALLKTLEEPPEHVIFVLATTEVHKIPNTILSRCQRFDFRRISTRKICEHLEAICHQENIQFETEALWSIARQGDGSMRDSQSLLDQVVTFSQKNITLKSVVDSLGLTDRSILMETLEALVLRDLQKSLQVVAQIFSSGLDINAFSQDLLEEIRHLLMVKIKPINTNAIVDLPDSEIEFLKTLASKLSEEDIHMLFDMALKGANDVPRAQEPRLVLEMLLLRMAQAPRILEISDFLSTAPRQPKEQQQVPKEEPLEKPIVAVTSVPPVISEDKPPPMPIAPLPTTPDISEPESISQPMISASDSPLDQKWLQLVEKIKAVNSVIAAKLEHSYPTSLQDEQLTIAIPSKMKFLHQKVNQEDFRRKLENYIKTFWGQSYQLNIQLEGSAEKKTKNLTPKALSEKIMADEKQKILTEVEAHPLYKQAQTYFKTQIYDIKETK